MIKSSLALSLQFFWLLTFTILLSSLKTNGQEVFGNEPTPGTLFMYPERIPLEAGGFYVADRGIIFVQTNRAKAETNVLALEIYRFKAKDKLKSNNPPIFFLAGGPSFQGLEGSLAKMGTFENRWEPMTEIADVVVISQRGIGSSKPTTLIEQTIPRQAVDQPIDYSKRTNDFIVQLEKEKIAWESLGIDLSGYTITEAVEDINEVRQALGYGKIKIWGGSFGSHWGMAFMRKYPELVERAILRGMEGPDHTYDHPGHLWNVYKRVAEDAENAAELAPYIPESGLMKALDAAIEKAEENPTVIKVDEQDVLINGDVVRSYARGYSRNLKSWPACVIDLYNGHYDKVAKDIAESYADESRVFKTASFWMLDCGSGITPERLKEHESDPAMNLLPHFAWRYKKGCEVWESDMGEAYRENFYTDIPTVIVQGTWDTSTPYENAVELVPFFRQSKFITSHRGSHGTIRQAFRHSKAFKKALFKFAETGDISGLPENLEIPIPEWTLPLKN